MIYVHIYIYMSTLYWRYATKSKVNHLPVLSVYPSSTGFYVCMHSAQGGANNIIFSNILLTLTQLKQKTKMCVDKVLKGGMGVFFVNNF